MGEAGTLAAPVQMTGLVRAMAEAAAAVETWRRCCRPRGARRCRCRMAPDRAAERHQHRAHGLSWVATYLETLRQTAHWAARRKPKASSARSRRCSRRSCSVNIARSCAAAFR